MSERCVVCGQPLPAGINQAEMRRRLDKLGAAAAEREALKVRRELDIEYRVQLEEKVEAIREREATRAKNASAHAIGKALREAKASSRHELSLMRRKVEASEDASRRAAAKAAKRAAMDTAKASRKEMDVVKNRAARESAQHAAETARFKTRVDELSLKLERQTSEQMGEMTEAEALVALRAAFPQDDIQRIGHGVRGADILHKVIVEGAEVGRIVYECKNATSWASEWVTKARSYRSEYQTQWVVIASRCFPKREKGFAIVGGIPVIELRLVVRLAEVIRAAVVAIGSLRLTTVGRQAKAEQMFDYVLGDHFTSRFKGVAEAVGALRSQQDKEKRSHSETWAKQTHLYDEVESNRREIGAQLRAIAEAPGRGGLRVVAGKR